MDFNIKPIDIRPITIDIKVNKEFSTRYISPPKPVEINEAYLKYQNAAKLAKDLTIEKESRYFVIIDGTFYFGDFIEALLVEKNYNVLKMTISTLSLNQNNIDSLANLLIGDYVQELNLIVSDYFYSHERNDLIKYIYQELDIDDKFQLAVAGTHCKLCIFETECGKKITIHGSANLRTSSNIEQFMIEENESLYNFNNEFQDKIIEKYKTIKKSLRYGKLWETIK
jgi:hypothetical protein